VLLGAAVILLGHVALTLGFFYGATSLAFGYPPLERPLVAIVLGGAFVWAGVRIGGPSPAVGRRIAQASAAIAGVLFLYYIALRVIDRPSLGVEPREVFLAGSVGILLVVWHRHFRSHRRHRPAGSAATSPNRGSASRARVPRDSGAALPGEALEFGITREDLRRVSAWGAVLAVSAFALLLVTGFTRGTLHAHWGLVIGMPTALGLSLPAVVSATSVITIRVHGDVIQEVLLGRTVLAEQRTSDLVGIAPGSATVLVLEFRDGSHMRLYGASRETRRRLIARVDATAS
jgi:hypothetical protein